MQKNALFFRKKLEKSPQLWGLRPQTPNGLRRLRLRPQAPELLLLSPVTVLLRKAFTALTSLLSKKEQKISEIAIMFLLLSLISYFKLCIGYPSYATGSDFSATL